MNQKRTKGTPQYEKNVFFWAWSELPLPPITPPPNSGNQWKEIHASLVGFVWQRKPFLNKGATPPGRGPVSVAQQCPVGK